MFEAAASSEKGVSACFQPPEPDEDIPLERFKAFPKLLEAVRNEMGSPALAAAVVHRGKIVHSTAVGQRRVDSEAPVSLGDRFHIGSITKSFTATLVAALIERQALDWDTTVGESIPDLCSNSIYSSVTLEELLAHRGGIVNLPSNLDSTRDYRDAREAREALVRAALSEEPVAARREKTAYSNTGYVVAAVMAERATGQSWETLLRERVLAPLDLGSVGFGWPVVPGRTDQPFGHRGTPPGLEVQEIGEAAMPGIDIALFMAPAGDLHSSVDGLAQYAAFHVAGLRGEDGVLRASTIRRLHTPPGGSEEGYAGGWEIRSLSGNGSLHRHSGSAGTFYAQVTLYPDSDLGVVVAANIGLAAHQWAIKLTETLYERTKAD